MEIIRKFWKRFVCTLLVFGMLLPIGIFSTTVQADSHTTDAIILCKKEIEGTGAPAETFRFRLTQVENEKGDVYTSGTPIVSITSIQGAGNFNFEIKDLSVGKYYFKIEEINDSVNGWTYDTTSYIVLVEVSGYPPSASVTYPTALPADIQLGDNETVPMPAPSYTFDESQSYTQNSDTTHGPYRFVIEGADGKIYEAACADLGFAAPPQGSILNKSEKRDHTESALAFALSEPYISGLTNENWGKFLALETPRASDRRLGFMQIMLWLYEFSYEYPAFDLFTPGVESDQAWIHPGGVMEGFYGFNIGWRLSGTDVGAQPLSRHANWNEYYHVATLLQEMMTQYNLQKTTSVRLSYTPINASSGKLGFDHDGFVPHGTSWQNTGAGEIYDTYLSWTDVPGLTVIINNVPYTSAGAGGIAVKKTDDVMVQYGGIVPTTVDFTLVDKQHYLSANSIKGDMLSSGNINYQRLVLGHASFVTLKSSLSFQANPTIFSFKNEYKETVTTPTTTTPSTTTPSATTTSATTTTSAVTTTEETETTMKEGTMGLASDATSDSDPSASTTTSFETTVKNSVTTTTASKNNPKTGDQGYLVWCFLMLAAGLSGGVIVVSKKVRKKHNK